MSDLTPAQVDRLAKWCEECQAQFREVERHMAGSWEDTEEKIATLRKHVGRLDLKLFSGYRITFDIRMANLPKQTAQPTAQPAKSIDDIANMF